MNYKHGRNGTSEYNIWLSIKARCERETSSAFPDYGGRGILLCERWQEFANFFSDMGEQPSSAHSIERKDNNGGYSPENCVWATKTEQGRNKRNNVLLTVDGETHPISTWAERYGLKYQTLHMRIRKGWPADAAVKTPIITLRKGVPRGERLFAFGAKHGVVFADDREASHAA